MLTGILAPTAGELSVLGRDPHRARKAHVREIGVVFGQRTQLWWDLAVVEAYTLLAAIFEVPKNTYEQRLRRLDDLLGLGPLLRTPVRELSLGQRMRCELAAALLHGPKILFLDEPTIGLDVAVKHRVRDFVRTLSEDGTTVLLTTHDLSDVEALCRRIVLLDRGRVLFDGTPDALKKRLGGRRQIVVDVASGTPPLSWGDGVDATLRRQPGQGLTNRSRRTQGPHRAQGRDERRAIARALEIQTDDAGLGLLADGREEFARGHVNAIAHRHDRVKSQAHGGTELDHIARQPAAL